MLLALSQVYSKDGLIFHRDGALITERALNYRLEQFAEKQPEDSPCRRMHSLRFTYASVLGYNNVPVATVQEQMGHTDQRMTEHYMRCFMDHSETASIINNAMSSLSHWSHFSKG